MQVTRYLDTGKVAWYQDAGLRMPTARRDAYLLLAIRRHTVAGYGGEMPVKSGAMLIARLHVESFLLAIVDRRISYSRSS